MDFNSTNIEDWKNFVQYQFGIIKELAGMCGELIDEMMQYRNAEEINKGLEKTMKEVKINDGERV